MFTLKSEISSYPGILPILQILTLLQEYYLLGKFITVIIGI